MKIDSDLSDLFKTDSDWLVGFAPTNFKAYILCGVYATG